MTVPKDKINDVIIELISQEPISDQHVLVQRLESRGVSITQSTLSRRLKKVGIAKRNGHYVYEGKKDYGLGTPILKITICEPNLIVIHTLPGLAQGICFELDQHIDYPQMERPATQKIFWDGLMATIAGYDTVIVVAQSDSIHQIKENIHKLFNFYPNKF